MGELSMILANQVKDNYNNLDSLLFSREGWKYATDTQVSDCDGISNFFS